MSVVKNASGRLSAMQAHRTEFENISSAGDFESQQHYLETVFELEAELRALHIPTLIMVGDRDAPCVEPSLLMCRWLPHAGLLILPACGHTPNIEEPSIFNFHVAEFLATVEAGRWAGW